MVRRVLLVVLLQFAAVGCSSVNRTVVETPKSDTNNNPDHQNSEAKQYANLELLLLQQSETLERQRLSIEELQQQREQMQKQLADLTQVVNRNHSVPSVVPPPVGKSLKPELVDKPAQVDASGKIILGQFEWAWFDLFADSVNARVDTGAKFSKLYATNVQVFERNGSGWVRFTIGSVWQGTTENSDKTFESPLVRKVKVKATGTTPVNHRPVIKLKTKVGAIVEDIEFVLHQRNPSNDGFPVMLGRSFVRDIAVVDVAQQYTQKKFTKAINP